jgi:hypothetical protein
LPGPDSPRRTKGAASIRTIAQPQRASNGRARAGTTPAKE